jgi:hypothetical protein
MMEVVEVVEEEERKERPMAAAAVGVVRMEDTMSLRLHRKDMTLVAVEVVMKMVVVASQMEGPPPHLEQEVHKK